MAGGFLGDFVKGRLKGAYPQALEQGIRLHRHIDSYTDRHPALRDIRTHLPDEYRRYAGIIADLLCDHYLALNWDHFSERDIDQFNLDVMRGLSAYETHYPEPAHHMLQRMRQGDWLLNYHRVDFVCGALSRIGQRLKHVNPLESDAQYLSRHFDTLLPLCANILFDTSEQVENWRTGNH